MSTSDYIKLQLLNWSYNYLHFFYVVFKTEDLETAVLQSTLLEITTLVQAKF